MVAQGNQCPVCSKLFHDPRRMPCKHIYCFKCIPRLHRRDLDTKEQIAFECRVCGIQHRFHDWSTLKYYVTLNCVPCHTHVQSENTFTASKKSMCSSCFNQIDGDSDENYLELCVHCNKNICHECSIDHRTELKKNVLQTFNKCRSLIRKNEQLTERAVTKLENMKIHIDISACEMIDQVDTYCESMLAQIHGRKVHEETHSSSGYESQNEQHLSDVDSDMDQGNISQNSIILTEPSAMPVHLLGQLVSSGSNILTQSENSSISQPLWSISSLSPPSHIIFESESSKLFTCTEQGYVSVYNCTPLNISLINTFYLQFDENSQPMIIKSLAASDFALVAVLNSSTESILHFYSHNGLLLHSLSLFNEYISQIRFDHNCLWCLELMSSSLFYFKIQSNNITEKTLPEKMQFISFKDHSFRPFRFAINQIFIAILDRAPTGIILLFNKYTGAYLKEIRCPFTESEPCDIELSNQLLIYRLPNIILLTQIDNEQDVEQIDAQKNLNITKGKWDKQVLVSKPSDDNTTFLIQCYVK